MAATTQNPARTSYRPVGARIPTFPRITRRETPVRQNGQMTYLLWRLEVFFKDHSVAKDKRKQTMTELERLIANGVRYEDLCARIETIMDVFLRDLLAELQSIYDTR